MAVDVGAKCSYIEPDATTEAFATYGTTEGAAVVVLAFRPKDPTGYGLPRQGITKDSYSLRICCSLISRDKCCSATDIPQVKRRCTWRCIVADLILALSYTRIRR
jgi:hypothetical protein